MSTFFTIGNNIIELRLSIDKGLRPSWRWIRVQAEPDKPVEDCWQGVFDPFDAECECKQNPTNQSKTVNTHLWCLCWDCSV